MGILAAKGAEHGPARMAGLQTKAYRAGKGISGSDGVRNLRISRVFGRENGLFAVDIWRKSRV